VKHASERVSQAEKLNADGLMTERELEQTRQSLQSAKEKRDEAARQIVTADSQIAARLKEVDDPKNKLEFIRQYREAHRQQPPCSNWTFAASRQETRGSVTVSFKFTCKR
jgi:predicted  nucleic acid-binding Zn-ribbon protein